MIHHARSRGLSLIELMLVLAILAILAAIVLPRHTTASDEARTTAAETQLRLIREAIERYHLDHGSYPRVDAMWDALTRQTDESGDVVPGGRFGPYITEPPMNPWTLVDTVRTPDAATNTSTGWAYDESDGAIGAVGFDEVEKRYKGATYLQVRKLHGLRRVISNTDSSLGASAELNAD